MALGNAEIAPLQGTVADLLETKGRVVHAVPPTATVVARPMPCVR